MYEIFAYTGLARARQNIETYAVRNALFDSVLKIPRYLCSSSMDNVKRAENKSTRQEIVVAAFSVYEQNSRTIISS